MTEISDDEFALFQSLICREAGIHLAASKKPMLISRLMRRVGALNLESFGEYYRHVINDRGEELIRLLDAVSTNETWFFRNPKHFSFVKEGLCPALDRRGEGGPPSASRDRLERRFVERRGTVLAGHGASRRAAGLGHPHPGHGSVDSRPRAGTGGDLVDREER